MTKYSEDRCFTDYVHVHLAVPFVYNPLGWTEKIIDSGFHQYIDIHEGVDYLFSDNANRELKLQERFRDNYYAKYNDFTLRYRRDSNPVASRHASEFFKIKADYMVYGITNGSKFADKRHTLTGFIKFVVVDLRVLFAKIESGSIILRSGKNYAYIENGKMIAALKNNADDSSSFVAFDVPLLNKLFGNEGIILAQKGFF